MIRVGLSGWSYPEWVGPFYPVALRDDPASWLAFYATRFRAVEIRSTFDASPGPDLVDAWARQGVAFLERAPFEYSLTLPREVTHRALPEGDRDAARDATGVFDREVLDPLAGEGLLGAVRVQLPPGIPPTREAVAIVHDVIAALAERRIALDLGDPRWLDHGVPSDEVAELFANRDVALVERSMWKEEPLVPVVGARHAYLRLQGSDSHLYSRDEMAPWAKRALRLGEGGRDVRVFFHNTADAKGTRNALEFLELLGQAPPGIARPKLTEQRKLEI